MKKTENGIEFTDEEVAIIRSALFQDQDHHDGIDSRWGDEGDKYRLLWKLLELTD